MLTQSMMMKTIKPSPMFQKRHYDWLASFMAGQKQFYSDQREWESLCEALIFALEQEAQQSGTNFKPALFRSACNA